MHVQTIEFLSPDNTFIDLEIDSDLNVLSVYRVIDQEPDVWVLSTRSITEGTFKQVERSKETLDSSKICLLDCGSELFIWTGRNTSLDARKAAITVAEASVSSITEAHCASSHHGYVLLLLRKWWSRRRTILRSCYGEYCVIDSSSNPYPLLEAVWGLGSL